MNRDDEIFGEAIELPAAERAAFLDRACAGDAARRARLDALLSGYDSADNFLENSQVTRPAPRAEEKSGDVLGHYTLMRKVGEGGCGVVWLADQREPVKRKVALKIIKLGMDTRQVIARFEAERQVLALMDHADIARVFDAGVTDTGRPFFVMEFVDGVPITKFCDEHSLSMATRLDLFARVCLALQHAHQKGIIHRDLKPSNILVALHDGVPAPKVIDFGIAKATQGRLTEHTLLTGFDQLIGTPAYMSPEQTELRDLDTRSDVYSLGVLLYELLTGRPPYDPQSLMRAGVEEIRRIIREVDPPRPSTRVSTLTDADRDTIARARRAAPAQLTSVLRGDLDWIVMRCLEKDRDRRYSTAKELADDVRRHLCLEPVQARPPTAIYRTQRFVARNRLACASAAAVALALIVGTIVSTRQAIRATRAEHVATAERNTAQAATRAEALARADAQRRQGQAEALLTFMLGDFRTELKKLGKLSLLDAVGEQAMAYFASLDPRDLTDTELTRQAKALTQIGETRIEQARYPEADTAFATALTRATALTIRHPRDANMLFERAQVEYWIGSIARRRGDYTKAREWFAHYRDSAIALVALEGKKLRAQRERTSGEHNLAVIELDRGNLAEAQQGFLAERASVEEMLAAAPTDIPLQFRLADIASWLGSVAELDGRYPDALERFGEMSERMRTILAQEPTVPLWKTSLADSIGFSADLLSISGQRAAALEKYAEAAASYAALVALDQANKQWQVLLLTYQLRHATLLMADGDPATQTTILAETREKLTSLVAAEPSNRYSSARLGTAWMVEARLRFTTGRAEALAAAERSVASLEPFVRENRADRLVRWDWAQAHLLAGRISEAAENSAAARQHFDRVIQILRPLAANSNDWHLLDPLAQALVITGQRDVAQPLVERLRSFNYHPIDPLAGSTLELAR